MSSITTAHPQTSPKVLVSACLLGQPVRYDGKSKPVTHLILNYLQQRQLIHPFCPECAGGLATPRPAAELQPNGQVLTNNHSDVTAAFKLGAELALAQCQKWDIRLAILKEYSPSCGRNWVYDGQFNQQTIVGQGVTTQLLIQNQITVLSEIDLQAYSLEAFIESFKV